MAIDEKLTVAIESANAAGVELSERDVANIQLYGECELTRIIAMRQGLTRSHRTEPWTYLDDPPQKAAEIEQ